MTLLSENRRVQADPLWKYSALCEQDARPERLNLIVGVYRNDEGVCPTLRAVTGAERRLLEHPVSKAYVGPSGNQRFVALLAELVVPNADVRARMRGIQAVAGTGALRLLSELLAQDMPDRTVLLGTPAYINHRPILTAAGLQVEEYPLLDAAGHRDVQLDIEAITQARPGDVVLIQGCCHNPTGTELIPEQWDRLGQALRDHGVIPFFDQAYFGLGNGLDRDLAGMRHVLELVPEAVVSVSASKAWGLYSERAGGAFIVSPDAGVRDDAMTMLETISRAAYSQPSAHGALIVETVLGDPGLRADWRVELDSMRDRLNASRRALVTRLEHAHALPADRLAALQAQRGMFLALPCTPEQMAQLRDRHAIHGLPGGRINLAGVPSTRIDDLAAGLSDVLAAG